MPALYAHHHFGEQVLEQLNDELKNLIEENKRAFMIGLQGPDVFFFYHPWKQNDMVRYGNALHETPARALFEQGLELYRYSAEYAYMLGVACHYALDSACHPYVAQQEADSGVPHMEIESEFEKMLLRRNGEDPFTYRTDLLVPTDLGTAEAMCRFYQKFDAKKIQFALRWMQNFRRLFTEPRAVRQNIMNGALTVTGFGKYKGQILQLKDNPACAGSNARLYQLMTEAVPLAAALVQELDDCKQNDYELSDKWDQTFA